MSKIKHLHKRSYGNDIAEDFQLCFKDTLNGKPGYTQALNLVHKLLAKNASIVDIILALREQFDSSLTDKFLSDFRSKGLI